ncbi:hypothetical protein DPMN_101998 [Dreissena polymorpha]|uniref:Tyrosinase copper-binding domain-containing protein n=1 Tax=Dreissena polymorpha TaxID=45954 RepID=A0A9D4LIH2_DREPO|nr:hypothetical protein DPMN_101998 [Dreissena polymorpha]
MWLLQKITVVLCVSVIIHADPLGNFLPHELAECVNRLTALANATDPLASVARLNIKQRENTGQQASVEKGIDYAGTEVPRLETPEDVHFYCIQKFVWKADMVRWEDYNITQTNKDFINGLLASMMKTSRSKHSRSKRQAGGPGGRFPPTGFRVRREIRRISDGERRAFFGVVRILKMNGVYDIFARYHMGITVDSAHGGPNFLGWHRVYLAMFEEAIRRIDRRLSLPFWDSTLDYDMVNPVHSIVWSPAFFGNGDGPVITGPFRYFAAHNGPLGRNIGFNSSLLTKESIRNIMTRCLTSEIVPLTAAPMFDLDALHGGPHMWVGGQLSMLETAAFDPVFFLHHAFIDYIWEIFRIHQFFDCGVKPNTDYPHVPDLHAALRPMDALQGYINIDGYRNYWTQFWYRYERSPTCPFCGSPYLRCDPIRGVCVSRERRLSPDEGSPGPMGYSAAGTAASPRAARARAFVATLGVGRQFPAPPAEPRTQIAQASMALMGAFRRKRRAVPQQQMTPFPFVGDNSTRQNIMQPLAIGAKFLASVSEDRTLDVLFRNNASGMFTGQNVDEATQAVYSGHAFRVAEPMPLLPVPVWDTLDSYMENPSSYITNSSAYDWLFVPVQVTYNAVGAEFSAQIPSMKCLSSDSILSHIKVSAQGLNYLGEYTDYAAVDNSIALASSHAIVAIRAPVVGPSISMVTASHGCGLMCKPMCIDTETGTLLYKPCTGILWIKPEDATAYVRSHDEAVESLARGGAKVPIMFECHKESQAPWQKL